MGKLRCWQPCFYTFILCLIRLVRLYTETLPPPPANMHIDTEISSLISLARICTTVYITLFLIHQTALKEAFKSKINHRTEINQENSQELKLSHQGSTDMSRMCSLFCLFLSFSISFSFFHSLCQLEPIPQTAASLLHLRASAPPSGTGNGETPHPLPCETHCSTVCTAEVSRSAGRLWC